MTRMNIPLIASVEEAVVMYYSKVALTRQDIMKLFPGISSSTAGHLKSLAKEQAAEEGRMEFSDRTCITECAYKAWRLDIKSLERRLDKLKKYGICQDAAQIQEATA